MYNNFVLRVRFYDFIQIDTVDCNHCRTSRLKAIYENTYLGCRDHNVMTRYVPIYMYNCLK